MEDEILNSELLLKAGKTAQTLMEKLKEKSVTLALSESCTAGLISALLACIPGSSNVLWGSFVCYTREAKKSMLGIDGTELDAAGLVSEKTAVFMASSALKKSGADYSASVTGLAGPDGDGSSVPVGTVWTAVAGKNGVIVSKEHHFKDSRNDVRLKAAISVFESILSFMGG